MTTKKDEKEIFINKTKKQEQKERLINIKTRWYLRLHVGFVCGWMWMYVDVCGCM